MLPLGHLLRRALGNQPTRDLLALERVSLQVRLHEEYRRLCAQIATTTPDHPVLSGFKVYSQFDEDGILEYLCDRLSLSPGTFVEIGCGDGTENNTHYLLLKGWRGVWIDADPAHVASIRRQLPLPHPRLSVLEARVAAANAIAVVRDGLASIRQAEPVDLLSIDIDSHDLDIGEALVAELAPPLLVVEYNAKFRWPLMMSVREANGTAWSGNDYFGASLAAWVQLLGERYRLVCCGLSGVNAFFVRADLGGTFPTLSPAELYQPARYHLIALESGHRSSLSALADELHRSR